MTGQPYDAPRAEHPARGPALPTVALTIWQPWTFAIAAGFKTVENRSWSHPHRGPIALHAGLSVQPGVRFPDPTAKHAFDEAGGYDALWNPLRKPVTHPGHPLLAVGAIIAVANLTAICDSGLDGCDCGPWAVPDQIHWRLTHIAPLTVPVVARGRQGLWGIPADVAVEARHA